MVIKRANEKRGQLRKEEKRDNRDNSEKEQLTKHKKKGKKVVRDSLDNEKKII